jgi:hypothetical protein
VLFAPARRSLGMGGSRASCARRSSPAVANSSGEGRPFVAWHSGRQNSTGRETSFCVIAYTGRFGDGVFGRKATSKPAPFVRCDGEKLMHPVLAPLDIGVRLLDNNKRYIAILEDGSNGKGNN